MDGGTSLEMPSSAQDCVRADVLILGGGITGLWLLNELHRKGYSALLLERRELGGEQTCHSHVYLHQGYLYNMADLAARIKGVRAAWDGWMQQHSHQRWSDCSYFGFRSPYDASQKGSAQESVGRAILVLNGKS